MKRISSVYFFPFQNTYKFQYLGELGGKQFKMYLAFSWYTPQVLIFYGRMAIQVRRTRPAGHCWRSRDELIRDVLLWTPTYGRAKAGRPAPTYIQQLCEDTGCCPEDLPRAMNDREEWRERVRDIRAASTTWWWWWWSSCQSILLSFFRSGLETDCFIRRLLSPNWILFTGERARSFLVSDQHVLSQQPLS